MHEDGKRLPLKDAVGLAQDVLDLRAYRLSEKEDGFLRDIITNSEDPAFPYNSLTLKQTTWLNSIFDRVMK